ncbi:MAG: hypothetical protein AMJ65_14220 [Phycisphaerae bacterium SG8_4]|nr:MAG: hypothetical protein AMJ65_14220 [Phycisphaerae bacterium SG8_4]
MSDYPKITYKKHTFLSSVAMGLSAIVITIIISCTVLVIYGIHFAGERSEKLVSLVSDAVGSLPELQEALPPALADVLDDRREPQYAGELEIYATTALTPDQHRTARTKIEVVNKGSEIVSLLSLRVVVFGSNGQILSESNEWAATPIAADHDWRGPLMPGSHRYFVSHRRPLGVFLGDELRTEVEITDLRVWNSSEKDPLIEDRVLSEVQAVEPSEEVQSVTQYQ